MDTRNPAEMRDRRLREQRAHAGPPRNNYGPESKFFDRCKGRSVRLLWKNTLGELCGKLLWVDRFTIGIAIDSGERELMVYKDSLKSIEPLNHPLD